VSVRIGYCRAVAISVLSLASAHLGCATGSGLPADDWSRLYVSTYERVFEAALDSLEGNDFYLDTVDEERGRIHAEASVRRGGDVTLIVQVEERPSGIRVDVMARSPDARDGRKPDRMSAVVLEFLRDLDARLEGRES
jgi:hypothetical protein